MRLFVVVSLALVVSCSDLYVIPEDLYLIKGGAHESNLVNSPLSKIRTLKSNGLAFTARFDESARYDLESNDQDDINKLMGFAEANSHHHDNSARIGWRYSVDKDQIEIFSYIYDGGDLIYQHLADVNINETIAYQINLFEDEYEFVVNGIVFRQERNADHMTGVYYMLFPYFGGNSVAPHDISIYIKESF
jgi:hypothetical protein